MYLRPGIARFATGGIRLKTKWWVAVLLLVNAALYLWATGVRTVTGSGLTVAKAALQPGQLRLYVAPTITAQKNYCLRVGPFVNKSTAVLSRTLLTTLGVQAVAFEASPDRRIQAYRIYMGPFKSRLASVTMRDHLNQLGIYDQYLVRQSNGFLLISLGLFTQNDGASRFLQNLRDQGLQAHQREEMRSLGASYWLVLNAVDEDKVRNRNWSDPRARLHRVICPTDIPAR